MKNYPNQAAEFPRVRSTLATIQIMNRQGLDVMDDAVLGYELARRRQYTFRGIDYATATPKQIADRIALEHQKPRADQGALTNARELRRTLQGLGWVDNTGTVTALGRQVLASTAQSQTERDLLATGLMNITATDKAGHVSHPVLMMLHLLHSAPSHRRLGLELALENKDDSQAEINRVIQIYTNSTTDAQIRAATGVTESQQRNNRKIFPTLAKYAGLVVEDAQHYFSLTPSGLHALGLPAPVQAATPPPPPPRPVSGGTPVVGTASSWRARRNLTTGQQRSAGQVGAHSTNRTVPSALTPDQQAEAQNRLNERTTAHQALVQLFAARIGDASGDFWEDQSSFDLVWAPNGAPGRFIFEMKTIQADADAQVVRAVGQLAYYSYFNAAKAFPGAPMTQTLVVDDEIPEDLCEFLEAQGIGAVLMRADGTAEPLNPLAEALVALLPVS